jgi:hypothetical protein
MAHLKPEIHIKPVKVLGYDAYRMKVGKETVTYRTIQDVLLDIARTYEPPTTLIHKGCMPAGGQAKPPKSRKGGKQGFSKFVYELLEGQTPLTCNEVAKLGHGAGDKRPLKSYSAALRNLEKAGKIK